jgi:hypothetical protein
MFGMFDIVGSGKYQHPSPRPCPELLNRQREHRPSKRGPAQGTTLMQRAPAEITFHLFPRFRRVFEYVAVVASRVMPMQVGSGTWPFETRASYDIESFTKIV